MKDNERERERERVCIFFLNCRLYKICFILTIIKYVLYIKYDLINHKLLKVNFKFIYLFMYLVRLFKKGFFTGIFYYFYRENRYFIIIICVNSFLYYL